MLIIWFIRPPENKQKTGIPNTGATGHYLQADATHRPSTNTGKTIHVVCTNDQTIKSSKPCWLYFPVLHEEVCEGYITPSLAHRALVSIGKLCDAGCTAVFKSQQVTIKRNGKIFIQRPRDRRNWLWKIPLTAQLRASPTQPKREQINNKHRTSSLPDMIQYLHDAAFRPVLYTRIEEIYNGFFIRV